MKLSESQREIATLLRRRGAMTVEGLSRALGISTVAVRQHLEALQSEGLLEMETERRPIGRPRRLYTLSEAADELFPQNYSGLAQLLLEHLERIGGEDRLAEVFRERRLAVVAELQPSLVSLDLGERVQAVVRMQDEAGYMAEAEAQEDGSFVLREFNCVVCKLARRFPQICASELALIEELTGAEVVRESHMAGGDASCSYRLRGRELN